MRRTKLWKLERRVDSSVNTQLRGLVAEKSRADGFSPNPGNVRPWGIQCVLIPQSPIVPTAIEESEIMMPSVHYLSIWHFNYSRRHDNHLTGNRQGTSYNNSLAPILLQSAKGGDKVAPFIALTMRYRMELVVQEQLKRPTAAATQHPISELGILQSPLTTQQQKMIQAG